jgi:hypothetical protein
VSQSEPKRKGGRMVFNDTNAMTVAGSLDPSVIIKE